MKIPWLCAVLLAYPVAILSAQDATDPAQTTGHSGQAGAQVLLLDDVVREALDKNPEAQSVLHAVKAARAPGQGAS
jgi:hypothetical protein